MKKVMIIFGTRPEAIKMCPLVLELKKLDNIECCICLTGQHSEMLDQVMEVFQIDEDYNLKIMKPCQTLVGITKELMKNLERVLFNEKPDLILVHGDTTTSYVAALMAFYLKIPIGHVEAGLRTYDMQAPYPEEFNRQSIDLISELYFAPTQLAKMNLIKEGKRANQIYVTGNTVIDALSTTINKGFKDENLEWAEGSKLILLTAHRRENIGEPMKRIFTAIKRLMEKYPDVKIIYPVHKNPKVRELAEKILGKEENIKLIEPLDVIQFHNYMNQCYFVMTDSGGIQEEAPSLGKPVLVLRETTERPEGLEAGTLKIVGTDENRIFIEAEQLLINQKLYKKMSSIQNPYGDGQASKRIADTVNNFLESTVDE